MRPKNRSRNSIPSDSFGMYTSITRRASSQPSSSPTRSTTGSLNRARGSSLRASIFIFSTACPIPSIPSSSYHGCVVSREAPGIDLIGFVLCPVVPPAATRDPANQDSGRHPDNVESTERSRAMVSQLATVTAEFAGEWTVATPTGIMANASGEPTSGTSGDDSGPTLHDVIATKPIGPPNRFFRQIRTDHHFPRVLHFVRPFRFKLDRGSRMPDRAPEAPNRTPDHCRLGVAHASVRSPPPSV